MIRRRLTIQTPEPRKQNSLNSFLAFLASWRFKSGFSFLLAHKLAVVLALAFAVRLAVLLAFPQVFAFDQTGQVHGSDAYDVYAQNLLATGVYGRTPGVPDSAIPPLYSFALAAVYAVFGRGYLQVGLFHIALDLASITMLYWTGRRLFPRGDWVGALAGLFYAGYPYLVFQNLTLIDTPFFMALLHAFVLIIVLLRDSPPLHGWRSARSRTPRNGGKGVKFLALLGGIILGLATLTRPILPLFALLVALWFLFRLSLRQTLIRLLPVALVAALLLIPWMWRNYNVYRTFVPMSLTAGANFYQGNNPDVISYMRAGYDAQWTGPDALVADPYSPEGDRERSELAWRFLRENPSLIPELLWVKLTTHWSIDVFPRRNPVEGQLPRLDYQGDAIEATDTQGDLELGGLPEGDPVAVYAEPLFDRIGRTLHRYYFGALFVLALVGMVVSARRWRDVSLLWFMQFSMTVVYVVFHPSTRYRVPSDPLLFLFSACALVWLWERWRAKGLQSLENPVKQSSDGLSP